MILTYIIWKLMIEFRFSTDWRLILYIGSEDEMRVVVTRMGEVADMHNK